MKTGPLGPIIDGLLENCGNGTFGGCWPARQLTSGSPTWARPSSSGSPRGGNPSPPALCSGTRSTRPSRHRWAARSRRCWAPRSCASPPWCSRAPQPCRSHTRSTARSGRCSTWSSRRPGPVPSSSCCRCTRSAAYSSPTVKRIWILNGGKSKEQSRIWILLRRRTWTGDILRSR